MFLRQIEKQKEVIFKNEKTTAVHTRGTHLQIYRMFKRDGGAIDCLRKVTEKMPDWNTHPKADWESTEWEESKAQVDQRMRQHKAILPIVNRGVLHNNMAFLIHGYKFETDDVYKVEVAPVDSRALEPERGIETIANAISCLNHVQPEGVAIALLPYQKHESDFMTLSEYLSQSLPPDVYNLLSPPKRLTAAVNSEDRAQ